MSVARFPFEYIGRLKAADEDGDAARVSRFLGELRWHLERPGVKLLTNQERQLEFTNQRLWSQRGWDLLTCVSRGRIDARITDSGAAFVAVRLRFTWLLTAATLVVGVVIAPAVATGPPGSLWGKLAILVGAWLMLVLPNYAVTVLRVRSLVEKAWRDSAVKTGVPSAPARGQEA